MNVFRHFQLNEAEKPMMFGEQFVVVSDDRTFLADIGECNTQDRAHFCKQMTELVENNTKVIDGNFVLFMKNSVYFFEVILYEFQIEFLWMFHVD